MKAVLTVLVLAGSMTVSLIGSHAQAQGATRSAAYGSRLDAVATVVQKYASCPGVTVKIAFWMKNDAILAGLRDMTYTCDDAASDLELYMNKRIGLHTTPAPESEYSRPELYRN